jgi:hypothetical protein
MREMQVITLTQQIQADCMVRVDWWQMASQLAVGQDERKPPAQWQLSRAGCYSSGPSPAAVFSPNDVEVEHKQQAKQVDHQQS